MKIVHISTYKGGGAAAAALRLHRELIEQGHESNFLFLDKGKESKNIFKYSKKVYVIQLGLRILKKLGLPLNLEQKNDYKIRRYKYEFEQFSFAGTPYTKLAQHQLLQGCDVIHLHFVANFIDYSSFFRNSIKPIVWTLHDMNPIQGGFHYKNDEWDYASKLNGLDEKQYSIKRSALDLLAREGLSVVAPSLWLMKESQKSEILGQFQHYHIPNGIDVNVFKPRNRKECIHQLNLQDDRPIILFVAESLRSYRKGFDRIIELVRDESLNQRYNFVAVGEIKSDKRPENIIYLGKVKDELTMSVIYNAASVFILPSREDNLPNTMVESLCCGTPVVAFSTGGITETIINGKNGFLSSDQTVAGLTNALNKCIQQNQLMDKKNISETASKTYDVVEQARHYVELYEQELHNFTNNFQKLYSENI